MHPGHRILLWRNVYFFSFRQCFSARGCQAALPWWLCTLRLGAVFLKFRFCAFKLRSILTRVWFLLYSALRGAKVLVIQYRELFLYLLSPAWRHGALTWAGNWSDFPWAPQDNQEVLIYYFHVLFLLCGVFVDFLFFFLFVCLVLIVFFYGFKS